MPIRMVDDENNERPEQDNNDGGRRRSGGTNPLLAFLPALLALIFKRPKLIIPLLIAGVAGYFILGGDLGFLGGSEGQDGTFSMGCDMKEEVYDKAEVYASLAESPKNAMPTRMSLAKFAPERLNQGRQGSCVAWSSAYAARTIIQAQATGKNPDDVAFSPAYLYNQIALEGCQGAYIPQAMDLLKEEGVAPFSAFPYDEGSCSREPGQSTKAAAQDFKIRGYQRLTMDGNDYRPDILAIKQQLAQGGPVVIGMMVGGSFMYEMSGQKVWRPSTDDLSMRGFGGHAMCVIGYDDQLEGGAFQLMNSWGSEWGEDGIAWVRYKDFDRFVKEAYGVYPMGKSNADADKFAVSFGLIDNASGKNIPLTTRNGNLFATAKPIAKGTTFKIEVTNSIECYTYVFGQETDGSSYTLFPYSEKHSPFCGITGTRVFPRNQSLQADQVGNKDFFAILVTKQEIDYQALNNALSQSRAGSYQAKFAEVLGKDLITNIRYQAGETISFETPATEGGAVVLVIEVNKQ